MEDISTRSLVKILLVNKFCWSRTLSMSSVIARFNYTLWPDLFKTWKKFQHKLFQIQFEQDGLVQALCQGSAPFLKFWYGGGRNVPKVLKSSKSEMIE